MRRTLTFWVATALLLSGAFARADDASNLRAGIYMPVGFGGQAVSSSYGLDAHIGLGIRVYYIGVGAEAHYVYTWSGISGVSAAGNIGEAIFLGRFDLYPVANLKISPVAGGLGFYPGNGVADSSYAVAGGRIGYEGHVSRNFSMEPAFMALQSIGPQSSQTYLLTLSFALWNEALLGSLVSGAVAGMIRR